MNPAQRDDAIESADIDDPDSLSLAGSAIDSPLTTAELCRVVGSRVRELRQALNMTMSAFANDAGISLGMLSKIEHGQSAPSLSTLARLAGTAKVPVTALFRGLDEEHDLVIVRAGEGHEIHHDRGGPDRLYQDLGTLRGPNRIIEPMITTITEPGGVFPLYQHPGVEFLHVLEGSLSYGYGGKAYLLNTGDTMQIHGEVAHGPVELVELPVRFISIKVYPASETRSAAGG
ncbi:helix-turn-helix domain-containing protein [Candidatus Poriferisodalis multihospitum]|uniref:helix-turn-helix domain-containing protein n=1 Tax=Candidatus Poriferisodalis multihospitum TaxID=2983191 RepID=UPI002B25F4BE|nr:helix-turn-helix domain-containing protein [Candidatus Poriferisodalis multihospitum]